MIRGDMREKKKSGLEDRKGKSEGRAGVRM